MERRLPTRQEVDSYISDRRNWGRWGDDDEIGAMNLITPEKRAAAAGLVRNGRSLSLSRYFPKTPGPGNMNPAQHWMRTTSRSPGAGSAVDYYGIFYHGYAATHLDALCHVWNEDGMWNGRDAAKEITFSGAKFGSVDHWSDGIITRGVLFDIPKHRGEPFVSQDRPVHGWELEEVAKAQGVTLEPGDALVVYSGYEAWKEAYPESETLLAVLPEASSGCVSNVPAATYGNLGPERPGLHVSCLPFIRDNDVSLLVWDLMDLTPNGYDLPFAIHSVIFSYGVGILDDALLQPLAQACQEEGRYEFMLFVAPLKVAGGTGSPVNPIALF